MTRTLLAAILLVAAAAALVSLKVPVASSQGLTLIAARIDGELPIADLASELWQQATAVEVSVSAQVIARPIVPETRVRSITARALHNNAEWALLVEWDDPTRNDQWNQVDHFRDSVAVQFPLIDGQPFFCMGQEGGNVNVWHWKADWQTALAADKGLRELYPNMHVDYYPFTAPADDPTQADYIDVAYLPARAVGNYMAGAAHFSAVEDLVAGGFGSLTAQPAADQNVHGYGEWVDGRWRVVFSRGLASDQEGDATFAPAKVSAVAFAAWDGDNHERNGSKSTSQWVTLQFSDSAAPAAATIPLPGPDSAQAGGLPLWFWAVVIFLLVSVAVGVVIYFQLPK